MSARSRSAGKDNPDISRPLIILGQFLVPIISRSDALYLAMFCSDVISTQESIVLFRCASPCSMTDAVAWEYLGKLLTPDDAAVNTRHDHYQAPDIFEHNGRTYLLVTPVQEETTEIETETGPATETISYYDGCRLYQFADIDTGALLREDSGVLLEAQRVRGEAQTHHGACSAIDGLLGGIIFSQFEVDNPPDKFRLYKSNLHAP